MGSHVPVTDKRDLTGVFNLRDLGGITAYQGTAITPGRVYRSDGLHRLPVDERSSLVDLGITDVIDLRTEEEAAREGRFEHESIEVHPVPIVDTMADIIHAATDGQAERQDLLLNQYLSMSRIYGAAFATALELVADAVKADRTVVYHCTAGKDRTGVLTALILSGLGVDDEAVAADYARSAAAMQQMVAWYRESSVGTPEERMREMGLDAAMAERLMAAEPSTMLSYLSEMRQEYGHVTDYLVKIDAVASIARIGRALLHPV